MNAVPLKERLALHSEPVDGCLVWTGATANGYGTLKVAGRPQMAHRIAYGEYVGPVPAGFRIRQACANKLCINPDHLEAFTESTQGFLGTCAHGHPRIVGKPCAFCTKERMRRVRASQSDDEAAQARSQARRRYRRRVARQRIESSVR